jgi:hypothetical protein
MRFRASCVVFVASALGCSGKSSAPRTVSGAFTTVYRTDDGVETSKPGNNTGTNLKVVAAWVHSDSGYSRYPISQPDGGAADGGFSIEGVPSGPYFLEIDQDSINNGLGVGPPRYYASFVAFTSSSPDLSALEQGRPDQTTSLQKGADLTVSLDGLSPWNPGPQKPTAFWLGESDRLTFFGSQIDEGIFLASGVSLAAGATTQSKKVSWGPFDPGPPGLPDASKGDVEFIAQLSAVSVGSGASLGNKSAVTRFARVADLTLADGRSATRSLTLSAAPQTGSLSGKIAGSQWSALLKEANPAMEPVGGGQILRVIAYPGEVGFPHQIRRLPIELASMLSPPLVDVDYGTTSYGQFLGPQWQEVRNYELVASVDVPRPGTSDTFNTSVSFESDELMPAAGAIAPVVGPPRSPKIQGLNAFQAQSGVGLTPIISWSPPSVGSPTSYSVSIAVVSGDPLYQALAFSVYGATSLQIPPGFHQKGATYSLVISSVQAPWDTLDAPPLRAGVPFALAPSAGAVFAP